MLEFLILADNKMYSVRFSIFLVLCLVKCEDIHQVWFLKQNKFYMLIIIITIFLGTQIFLHIYSVKQTKEEWNWTIPLDTRMVMNNCQTTIFTLTLRSHLERSGGSSILFNFSSTLLCENSQLFGALFQSERRTDKRRWIQFLI